MKMSKYRSYILDVSEIQNGLDEINKNGSEIASMVYASDSQQVVIVVKENVLTPIKPKELKEFDKEEEPEEEEEED
jgi:hypothetical protein